MADRHGRAFWPGVQGFISCSYTCSHGITPGVATLTIPDQDVSKIAAYGMLEITDGYGAVKLPRCKVIDIQSSAASGAARTITLFIADRRWMWKFGGISGNWNQIDPYPDPDSFPPEEFTASGGPYAPGTYRTAEKLLADCLAALNEVNPLIEPAPQVPITVSWDNENPAAAMQALCDTLGYRVVYRPSIDQVAIVPQGVGIPLPLLPTIISGSDGIDPPERPNAIQLVAGDTIWNDYLRLEPVTFEQDGTVVTLDKCSYKPSVGWGRCPPPDFGQVKVEFGAEKCKLAQQHVWRTFRVLPRSPDNGIINLFPGGQWAKPPFAVPRYGAVTDRKQIVLGSQLFGLSKDERGQQRTEPAYVVGSVYAAKSFETEKLVGLSIGSFGNTVTGVDRLPIQPNIDTARGIVTFDKHLYRNAEYRDESDGKIKTPPTGPFAKPVLLLRTSFRIRSLIGMVFEKFKAGGIAPVAGDPLCPPEFIRHPELIPVINVVRKANVGDQENDAERDFDPANGYPDNELYVRLDVTDIADNFDDLKRAADYYLKAADQKYQTSVTSTRLYAGINPILPDGAVQQVTWTVGSGEPATTQASRNSEHATWLPNFAERRNRERIVSLFSTEEERKNNNIPIYNRFTASGEFSIIDGARKGI